MALAGRSPRALVSHDVDRSRGRAVSSGSPTAIVVGAGPAGSATALLLARAGIAVTLLERARFPRTKACGEYLGAGAVAVLERLGVGEAVSGEAQTLAGVRLFVRGGVAVELPFKRRTLSLARARLDTILLEAARAAGARLVEGHVEDLLFASGRVAGVRFRDPAGEVSEMRAGFVITPTGLGSLVARKLGLAVSRRTAGRTRFALGGHYTGCGELEGFVEMHVDAGAYFAINPLGPNLANVMVVVAQRELERWQRGDALEEAIRAKAAGLGEGRRSLAGAAREGARIAIGPLEHRVTSRVGSGARFSQAMLPDSWIRSRDKACISRSAPPSAPPRRSRDEPPTPGAPNARVAAYGKERAARAGVARPACRAARSLDRRALF